MKKSLLIIFALIVSFSVTAQFGPFNIIANDIGDPVEIIPIDFDMDGDMDAVVRTANYVVWKENLGLGLFSSPQHIGLEEETSDFDIVDFDNDGDYDVFVSSSSFSFGDYYENIGDEEFEDAGLTEMMSVSLLKSVDFDGDDNPDLIVIKEGDIIWMEGDGTGAIIEEHFLELDAHNATDFDLSDIDNDLDLDIVWCAYEDGGKVYMVENLGGGEFADRVLINSDLSYPNSVLAVDIDGDLDKDIVHGSYTFEDGGLIYWNENMGDGTFSDPNLVGNHHSAATYIASGDFDLDGDYDIFACSYSGDKVNYYENSGDGSFGPEEVLIDDLGYSVDVALADFDYDGDLDLYAVGVFPGEIGWFENATLSPRHAEGNVYYDINENGVMDDGELGLSYTTILSDPDATMSITFEDGSYVISFVYLPDGDYEIYPSLDYWEVVSPYPTHDITLSDDFVFMDTLDFGLIPSEIVNEIGTDITGDDIIRCSDTVGMWLSVVNMGTTFPSGVMHLELDDSLNYITSEFAPDSIDGQNVYWSYDELYYFEGETFLVEVGTPDGVEDTVTSVITSTIIELGEVVYTVTDDITQLVSCAFDPNDKTPDPLGEGPEGNISFYTEWIEYTIRFQNTGTDYAEDVIIRDQLDEDLIWTSIEPLYSSHEMTFNYDPSGEVAFVFNDIMLPDSNANEVESHGFVKYRVKLQADLAIGATIENTAAIYFDFNPPIFTNTTLNTIADLGDVSIPLVDNIITVSVYPNPAADIAYVTVNMEKQIEYTIHMYSVIGQSVYLVENLSADQTKINTSQLDKGLYILVIESSEDGEQIYNTKLVVE